MDFKLDLVALQIDELYTSLPIVRSELEFRPKDLRHG